MCTVRDLTQLKPRVDLVDSLLNRGPDGGPCSTAIFTPTCEGFGCAGGEIGLGL